MRGVTFKGNREAEIREFPDPHAGPGEAVLRIRASGLCGTDLHRYRGGDPTDMITGHEPCGVIEELGPGAPPGLKLGDRVMCHHYEGCGTCQICSMGYEQLCPNGHVTFGGGTGHGANADYMICPSRTLVHLPDELSFEEGAAISCGTGTAWNGLNKMDISGKDIVAVFGQGPVGLSGTLSAKAMGARVIAIDVMDERLRLGHEPGSRPHHQRHCHRPGSGHPRPHRRAGGHRLPGDLGEPDGAAADTLLPPALRKGLLCRRRRPR